jgi:hypothetical protein
VRSSASDLQRYTRRWTTTFNVEEFNAVFDNPCTFHEGGTHTVRECQQFKRAFHMPEDSK